MRKGFEKVYEYVVLNDNVPVQKLSLLDLLRTIVKELTKDISKQLDNDNIVNVELMTLQANLYDFLYKATDCIRKGEHYAVSVEIPSIYSPVLQDVINEDIFTKHYRVSVLKPDIEYDLPFNYTIVFEVIDI